MITSWIDEESRKTLIDKIERSTGARITETHSIDGLGLNFLEVNK
jgi:hypothetical protein